LPLEIRKHDRTPEGAPAPLVKLLEAHFDRVMDVRLDYARDEKTYVSTEMSVGVQKLEELAKIDGATLAEDAHDETPDEIGLAVLELATEHAQATGAVKYRAVLMGMKHDRYQKLDSCVFTLGLDYDTGRAVVGEVGPGRDETLQLAHDIAKDSHTQHMATLKTIPPMLQQVVGLVGEVANLAGPMAQAKVELKRLEVDLESERFDHEDREDFRRQGFGFLSKLADVFGVQLAKAWRDAGMPGSPPKSDEPRTKRVEQLDNLVSRWDRIFQEVGPDKLQELSDLMGEDLAGLAEKMRAAKDDHMFRNMAATLVEKARKDPGWPIKLAKIGDVLGMKHGQQFADVLAEATS